jgi:hypothetical protein
LASYKAFEFLKHGVEYRKKETEVKPQSRQTNSLDPYEFPPL